MDIVMPTKVLVEAQKYDLMLCAPVNSNDEILFDQAYWAKEIHKESDVILCGIEPFAFDSSDSDCMSRETHYFTWQRSSKASEFLLELENELNWD